jgi:ABC-type transport system involved in multi-copper enzyme maturation permease subunit
VTLFKQYFRVQRTGLLLWAGINGFMGWVLGASAKQMEATNALSNFLTGVMEKLPKSVQALMGFAPGISPVDNLIQGKIGFWMAIALPIYGCLMAVAAVSREIDRGTADFLLALPVDRKQVLVARWEVMALNLTVVAITTWGTLVAGLRIGGVPGNYVGYFWMIAQAVLLGLSMGSLALFASMWASDYEKAMKRSLAAVLVLFSIDIGMEMAGFPRITRAFNPFSYFSTLEPLLRRGPMVPEAITLLAISGVALALSARQFQKKQIEA